jgi:dipeptidase E
MSPKYGMPDLEKHLRTNFIVGFELFEDREVLVPKIVGAGKGMSLALPVIYDKVISLSSKSSSPSDLNVVYLGTASYDREDRFLEQTKGFKAAGCKIYKLNVSEDDSTPSIFKLRQIIVDWADIIVVSGGNTLYALIRWKEVGVNLLLKEAAEKGVVLCGGSAGCVCWFSDIHTDSMRPDSVKNPPKGLTPEEVADWEYYRIHGLGLISALCVPHYDIAQSNGKRRAEDCDRLCLDMPQTVCIGVDEKAALVIVGDRVSCISADGGKSMCYKKYVTNTEDGVLVEIPIRPDSTPMPLSELLSVP